MIDYPTFQQSNVYIPTSYTFPNYHEAKKKNYLAVKIAKKKKVNYV